MHIVAFLKDFSREPVMLKYKELITISIVLHNFMLNTHKKGLDWEVHKGH